MDQFIPILQAAGMALAAVVTAAYSYQAVYLLLSLLKKPAVSQQETPCRWGILIAARNEEAVIAQLLDSIAAQDHPAELVQAFVVADNCTDRTAELARAHGAKVYARFDRWRVGKGYALNYLLEQIDKDGGLDRYDAFLVFDADNLLRPDYLRQMSRLYGSGFSAFCGYRATKNFGDSWISSSQALMYLHESIHMNSSRMLLKTNCIVSGTGFGFTRELLERLGGWQFFTLTEDVEFNVWCATHGVRVGYCPDAVAYDEQPVTLRQSWRQRTRWVQGTFQVSLKYGWQILRGILRGSYASFEAATLSFWGCAAGLLGGGVGLLSALLTGGLRGGLQALALGCLTAYGGLFLIGALTLLSQWGRIPAASGRKLASLFAFPLYMMTYVPIALTALFQKFGWKPIYHTVAISAGEAEAACPPAVR